MKIWLNVNPKLPLIKNESIYLKLVKTFNTMKLINGKKCKKGPLIAAYSVLENLYDISACRCNLDKVPCMIIGSNAKI